MPMPEAPHVAGAKRPVYLLADSRLLFSGPGPESLPERLRADLPGRDRAAYLGAANGDEPAFFEIFDAAMEQLGIAERRQIPSRPLAADLAFLAAADLILLAGGEVAHGWQVLAESGAAALIAERYREGALLVGVSAGAVHLGHGYLDSAGQALCETSGLLPFLIDAHAEPEWSNLKATMVYAPEYLGGLGIPFGGAAIIGPDRSVEPFAKPVCELFRRGENLQEALLLPPMNPADAVAV